MEDAKLKAPLEPCFGRKQPSFRGGLGKSIATLKTAKSAKSHLYLGNFVREGEGSPTKLERRGDVKKKAKEKVYGWIESEIAGAARPGESVRTRQGIPSSAKRDGGLHQMAAMPSRPLNSSPTRARRCVEESMQKDSEKQMESG